MEEGLPPCLLATLSAQTKQGLRAGATIALRAHISAMGTRLRNGNPPAVTPLAGAAPSSVTLTRHGVLPLLRRAHKLGLETAGRLQEDAAAAAHATAIASHVGSLVTALAEAPDMAASLGVTPLFNLSHGPLKDLLRKRRTPHAVPGEPVFTGGGIRFTFPKVVYVRRMERTGEQVKAGRLFNLHPKGSSWLRPARGRGKNGAGLRTLSRDKRAWRCLTPGAYHPDAVPVRWRPWWDGARCSVLDPGVVLILCADNGWALSKAEYYRFRRVWADFVPKPTEVRQCEEKLGRTGGPSQAAGLLSFTQYVTAFQAQYPSLAAYYNSPAKARAKEHKGDKLRSLLDQVLMQLAPRQSDVICIGKNFAGLNGSRKGTMDGSPVLQVGGWCGWAFCAWGASRVHPWHWLSPFPPPTQAKNPC